MLLVTAFQPFDGSGLNSAQEALHAALPELGDDVVTAEPPVVWGRDVRAVWPLVAAHRPTAVLLLGQGGGARVRLETLARNQRRGVRPGDPPRPIVSGAPAALHVTAPADVLLADLLAAGLAARLSDDAGDYLCNHLYFQVLLRLNRHGWAVPAVFMHLPLLPAQAMRCDPPADSLSPEQLALAVRVVAQALRRAGDQAPKRNAARVAPGRVGRDRR